MRTILLLSKPSATLPECYGNRNTMLQTIYIINFRQEVVKSMTKHKLNSIIFQEHFWVMHRKNNYVIYYIIAQKTMMFSRTLGSAANKNVVAVRLHTYTEVYN